MTQLMTTKEVARHLGINEKMIYALISEKGLPASKVTGKWLFPQASGGSLGGGPHHQPAAYAGRCRPVRRAVDHRRQQ
jgi:excisionase family DNA binding protein